MPFLELGGHAELITPISCRVMLLRYILFFSIIRRNSVIELHISFWFLQVWLPILIKACLLNILRNYCFTEQNRITPKSYVQQVWKQINMGSCKLASSLEEKVTFNHLETVSEYWLLAYTIVLSACILIQADFSKLFQSNFYIYCFSCALRAVIEEVILEITIERQ